jgi:hypothetical protein
MSGKLKFRVGDLVCFHKDYAYEGHLRNYIGVVLGINLEEELGNIFYIEWYSLNPASRYPYNRSSVSGKMLTKYRGPGYQLRLDLGDKGKLRHE